jgi:hypothetical protein
VSRGLLSGVTCGVRLQEGKPKAADKRGSPGTQKKEPCALFVDETTAIICAYGARPDRETGGEDLSNCETGHELNAVTTKKMRVNISRDC